METEQIIDVLLRSSDWSWLAVTVFSLFFTASLKLVLKLISTQLRKFTSKTLSVWDDVGVDLIDGLRSYVVFSWFFYFLSKSMPVTQGTRRVFLMIIVALTIYQLGLWGLHVIRNWRNTVIQRRVATDPSAAAALGLVYVTAQIIFLVVLVLIGLSNIGVDIGALLAGLGVGGIAVALAAQNILGDLLASLSIVLDKPFVVGDFIAVGNDLGAVEQIGLKTTRLRSLSGEELIFSNKDLLESRVRNYKRMFERRVVQRFSVVYGTPPEILEEIPVWIKSFVESDPKLRFDRCHFYQYGSSSLDFELVFFVLDPDFNLYMDQQQALLLKINRKFAAHRIQFALPTQTIRVDQPVRMSNEFFETDRRHSRAEFQRDHS